MHFQTGIPALDGLRPWDGVQEYKLETPAKLMAGLGNPQDKIKTIHVAGTNGKGSVCCYLAAILFSAGYKVGQMCSPHLSDITERILINGVPIRKDILAKNSQAALEKSEELNIRASFFEVLTAACFLTALEEDLQYLLVEVGLGGRLDATNVISKPEVSVITSIGLDHTRVLGETPELIAKEKAGIIKQGVPVFIGAIDHSPKKVIQEISEGKNAPFFDIPWSKEESARKINSRLASVVAKHLSVSESDIEAGLRRSFWPGRLEHAEWRGKQVLIDVFHNPDGLEKLQSALEKLEKQYRGVTFLVSFLNRKDCKLLIDLLKRVKEKLSVPAKFVFTASDHHHVESPHVLKEMMGEGEAIEDCFEALDSSFENLASNELLVIGGSIFLVGLLRPKICPNQFKTILD